MTLGMLMWTGQLPRLLARCATIALIAICGLLIIVVGVRLLALLLMLLKAILWH